MANDKAHSWIEHNVKPIPSLPFYLAKAKELISNPGFDKTELSLIIASDPGLSIQLFDQANSKRKGTSRDYIESAQSALSLMGDSAVEHYINQSTSLDQLDLSTHCIDDFSQMVARSHQAAKHAKIWAEKRKSQGVKEISIATRLYDIAEYSLCLFEHSTYKKYYQKNLIEYSPDQYCNELLGFSLHDLSIQLCDHFHLPQLVVEAHTTDEVAGIRTQGIQLATKLVHLADGSWFSDAMNECIEKISDHCQISVDKAATQVHLSCIESVRELDFEVNFHNAINLVQYPSSERETKHQPIRQPEPTAVKTIQEPDQKSQLTESITGANPLTKLFNLIKQIAKNPQSSQGVLLNSLLKGLNESLQTTRSALFLISKDHSKLATRLHNGLEEGAPLLKFDINKQHSGLLKILIEKPQAIWINPKNIQKYDPLIPGLLKSCVLSNDYFMMSLFSGDKAIGIIFCDAQHSKNKLTKEQFNGFKKAIGLSAKAMQLMAQRTSKAKK